MPHLPAPLITPSLRTLAPWLLLVPALALAQEDAETPAGASASVPYVSPDGQYVFDPRSRLAWPRCVEGMQWNGKTCTGQAKLLDRGEAMSLATARWKAEDVRWRLPRANELRRMVNKAQNPPGMNPELFPNAPRDWHWSSSSNVSTGQINPYNYGSVVQGHTEAGSTNMDYANAWAVNMGTGEPRGDVNKSSKLLVRLVRPMPD